MSQKTVAQKLQVREGHKLLLVNPPKGYADQVSKNLPENATILKGTSSEADIVQVFTSTKDQLKEQLGKVKKILSSKTVLWITYLKGTGKIKADINRDIIREEAQKVGLEAVAIFSVDDDWSALRLKLA